jgi:hypothetical protein
MATLGAAAFLACVGDTPNASDPGKEGQPCFTNKTCEANLTCVSNVCVRLDAGLDGAVPDGAPDAGASDAGCDADLLGDSRNCGRCGHDCIGGSCQQGACQSWKIDNGKNFIDQPVVDGTNILFRASPGAVYSCPRTGCTGDGGAIVTGIQDAYGIAADPARIYVTNPNTLDASAAAIYACARGGCGNSPTVLRPGAADGIVIDGTDLYFRDGTANQKLARCTLPSCSSTEYLTAGAIVAFTLDGSRIYMIAGGSLLRCDKGNCSATTVGMLTGPLNKSLSTVAAGGSTLYAATYDGEGTGTIISCPTSSNGNCVPTALVTGLNRVVLHADATGVWFGDIGTNAKANLDGFLGFCPATGCKNQIPQVLLKANEAYAVSGDKDAVYVSQGGGLGPILGLAKP